MDRARLRGAGDRPHEPRVRRDALGRGRLLDRALERLGEAQADPRRELLADGARGLAGRVDEDELRLLPREADLDVAERELRVQLDRGLGEKLQELQPEVRAEGVAQAAGDLRRPLVAELGEPLEVFLQSFEDDCQIHRDITMTSSLASVKRQTDARSAPGCRRSRIWLNTINTTAAGCAD